MVIGTHKGKNRIQKVIGLISRIFELLFKVPSFDISISLGGNTTATISRLRNKPSIVFSDNDISFKTPAYKLGADFIFPSYFNTDSLGKKYGVKKEQIHNFNGFKEDILLIISPIRNFLTACLSVNI